MKTMAIRLSDETAQQLSLVAQLEGTSIIDLIRQAIERLLAEKRAGGNLAEKAAAALAEIDKEAAARRSAIQAMLGDAAVEATIAEAPKGRSRRSGSTADKEA